MVYEAALDEINSLRLERGLNPVDVDRSTRLEDLGFDSVMYISLIARLEERFRPASFTGDGSLDLPVDVAGLVKLFE